MASLPAQQPQRSPVHRAFERLPEDERTLITLVYWSCLSQAEAAARLDLPEATVETRARRALARLADLLEGDCAIRPAR